MDYEIIQKVRHIIQARMDAAVSPADADTWCHWKNFNDIFEYAVLGAWDNLEQFDYLKTAAEVKEDERRWG